MAASADVHNALVLPGSSHRCSPLKAAVLLSTMSNEARLAIDGSHLLLAVLEVLFCFVEVLQC